MDVQLTYEALRAEVPGKVLRDEPMRRHTTLRVGGPAALHVTCDSLAGLRRAIELLGEAGIPWVIMGRGSNVLVADEGYAGAVLALGSEFRRFTIDAENRMHAGAGAVLQRIATEAFNRGLAGLEFSVGVPGTVGGAVSMNAAADDAWMGRIVEEVVTLRPGHGMVRYAGSDISWYHRCCDIPAREVVLEATLVLAPGDAASVKRAMEDALQRRKATQPLEALACGEVFRDPAGHKAADLLAQCGLAGYARGDARLSPRDPNFIVNSGRATSADVAALIVHAREEVARVHGIELQPEVKFLGFAS